MKYHQNKQFQDKNYCKYFDDNRSSSEIQITNKLLKVLSANNFQRLQTVQPNKILKQMIIKKQNILYVCLHGIPPFQRQFTNLNLPGQTLQMSYIPYQKQFTEQEMKARPCTLQESADFMHQKIISLSSTKPIVFVYHSFGTFILSVYLNKYPSDRIIGIDIVGIPIRMYKFIKLFHPFIKKYSVSQIQQNSSLISQQFKKLVNQASIFKSIPIFLGYSKGFKKQQQNGSIFDLQRKWPPVIKCFINGNRDNIFSEQLKAEKIIYYTYSNKFTQQYQEKLRNVWELRFGKKCTNVQEKFIYQFDGGAHSVHIQKKHISKIQKIIMDYLQFLQDFYSQSYAKL